MTTADPADDPRLVEGLLRRVGGRLCIAARGYDPRLDLVLDYATPILRKQSDALELDRLIERLTVVIAEMDEGAPKPTASVPSGLPEPESAQAAVLAVAPVAVPVAASAVVDPSAEAVGRAWDSVVGFMQECLGQLEREVATSALVDDLKPGDEWGAPERLQHFFERLPPTLRHALMRSDKARGEVESLIRLLTQRLDTIARDLSDGAADGRSTLPGRELNERMISEVREMDSQIQAANSMDELRLQIRMRLDAIETHLRDFRTREDKRQTEEQERANVLIERISELESRTRSLSDSLQREQRQAMTDALTGLANRFAYESRIRQDFQHAGRHATPLALAVVDIDHFKSINDQFGHPAGDKVLRVISRQLSESARQNGLAARYGGEEFVWIVVGLPEDKVLGLLENFRQEVSRIAFHVRGASVPVTVSCGLAMRTDGDRSPEALFERADQALYAAKRSGRNRCVSA